MSNRIVRLLDKWFGPSEQFKAIYAAVEAAPCGQTISIRNVSVHRKALEYGWILDPNGPNRADDFQNAREVTEAIIRGYWS